MKSHLTPDHIDEEASQWAARLEGGAMTDNDQAAFSVWLNAHPGHRNTFSQYRELSTRLDAHVDALLSSALASATQIQTNARKWRRAISTTLAIAAAIAIGAFVLTNRPLQLATATAERHMTTLDDGSQVDLNAQTILLVDFRHDERRVRLASGEALFNVAKDPKRPFVVETPMGSIRVTGTVFNVRAPHTDYVEVTVLEGTVRVRSSGNSENEQPVTAGIQAVLSEKNVTVKILPDGAASDATAWRQGKIVFDDTPLSEALERFATYHARTINLDPKTADLRLGGRYSLEDLDGLLDAIESALPVRVSRGPGNAVRISPAKTPIR